MCQRPAPGSACKWRGSAINRKKGRRGEGRKGRRERAAAGRGGDDRVGTICCSHTGTIIRGALGRPSVSDGPSHQLPPQPTSTKHQECPCLLQGGTDRSLTNISPLGSAPLDPLRMNVLVPVPCRKTVPVSFFSQAPLTAQLDAQAPCPADRLCPFPRTPRLP